MDDESPKKIDAPYLPNERNTGLDFLRAWSMIMVVILHFLAKGGFLWNTREGSILWFIIWIIEGCCYTSVNCFVLISGYLLICRKESPQVKKLVELLCSMFFFSVTIYCVLLGTKGVRFQLMDLVHSFFPFITKSYWFMNDYIALYALAPFLNKMVSNINKREYQKLLAALLVFFCLIPSIIPFNEWYIDRNGGYSFMWFCVLYLLGGYVRIYGANLINNKVGLMLFISSGLLCCLSRFTLLHVLNSLGKNISYADIWYNYNSIPVIIASIGLIYCFMKIKIKTKTARRIITFLSVNSLGIYLFHEQSVLKRILWQEILHVDNAWNSWIFLAYLFFSIVIISTIGVGIHFLWTLILKIIEAKLLRGKQNV